MKENNNGEKKLDITAELIKLYQNDPISHNVINYLLPKYKIIPINALESIRQHREEILLNIVLCYKKMWEMRIKKMANTFKVITRDVMPASAGTPETLYTVQSGSTVVVLGLTLANVHTAQVTASVTLVSTTTQTSQTQNTTANLIKDVAIPAGSSLDILAGKIVLNVGDIIKVDCSVADKVSCIMSYMEQT